MAQATTGAAAGVDSTIAPASSAPVAAVTTAAAASVAAEASVAAPAAVTERVELLQQRVERAQQEKQNAAVVAGRIRADAKAEARAAPLDPDDDPSKPVAVRSVLQKLRPSDNRYSFSRNSDEL